MLETWVARRVRRTLRGSACFLDLHPGSDLPFRAAMAVLDRPGRAIIVVGEAQPAPSGWSDASTRCSVHVIRTDPSEPDRIRGLESAGAPLVERTLSPTVPPSGVVRMTTAVGLPALIAGLPRLDLVRVRAGAVSPALADALTTLVRQRRVARLLITVDPSDMSPGLEDALRLIADLERSGCVPVLRPWLLEGRGRTWRQHFRVAARPFVVDVAAPRTATPAVHGTWAAGADTPADVLILVDHADIGGGTTVAMALAEQWQGEGRTVHLTAMATMSPDVRDRLPAGTTTELGASGHAGRLLALRSHLGRQAEAGTTLLAIGEYPALAAVLVRSTSRRLASMPIVLAEHQPHSLGEVLGRRPGPIGRVPGAVVRTLRRRTAASIFLSEQHRDELLGRGIGAGAETVVIPNPCVVPVVSEATIAARLARRSKRRDVRLLTIGSLNAAKGHDTLLRALALLEARFRLSIVGSGDRAPLEALAQQLRLSERVDLLGTRLDVAEVMDEHDVFVLPSRYESFGLVVIEAIVRGLPVVATACNPTIPVLAERIESLMITPVDDVDAMAAAIARVAAADWSIDTLLSAARTVSSEHDPATAATAHLELFTRIRGDRLLRP